MWFFQVLLRRQHQKLDESNELPGLTLTHRPSDESIGSGSTHRFDPNRYTLDANESAQNAVSLVSPNDDIMLSRMKVASEPKVGRSWILGRKAKPATEKTARMLNTSLSDELSESSRRKSKDLAELDNTVMSLLASDSFGENETRSVAVKARRIQELRGATWSTHEDSLALTEYSQPLHRGKTWGRRLSSLEACFGKGSANRKCSHDKVSESAIMKIKSFDSDVAKHSSRKLSLASDDSRVPPLELIRTSEGNITKMKTFEEQVEHGVAEIIGHIAAKGEELLDSVPDWSVGSSSSDFYTSTSDDDDTSVSGTRHHRRRPNRSESTLDDDADNDEDGINLGGCYPIKPCHLMTNDIRTLLNEVLSEDARCLNCFAC
jgi:hypothetical protein